MAPEGHPDDLQKAAPGLVKAVEKPPATEPGARTVAARPAPCLFQNLSGGGANHASESPRDRNGISVG